MRCTIKFKLYLQLSFDTLRFIKFNFFVASFFISVYYSIDTLPKDLWPKIFSEKQIFKKLFNAIHIQYSNFNLSYVLRSVQTMQLFSLGQGTVSRLNIVPRCLRVLLVLPTMLDSSQVSQSRSPSVQQCSMRTLSLVPRSRGSILKNNLRKST